MEVVRRDNDPRGPKQRLVENEFAVGPDHPVIPLRDLDLDENPFIGQLHRADQADVETPKNNRHPLCEIFSGV
jgi:hypothetical protein